MRDEYILIGQSNIEKAQSRQKKAYDRRKNYISDININDMVMRKLQKNVQRKGGKLEKKFAGPYKVVAKTVKGNCQLEDTKGKVLKTSFPINQLKKYLKRGDVGLESETSDDSDVDQDKNNGIKVQKHSQDSLVKCSGKYQHKLSGSSKKEENRTLWDQEMLQDHRILQVPLQNRTLQNQEMLQDHRILQVHLQSRMLQDQEMLQDHRILQVHLQSRILLDEEMLQDHRILQVPLQNRMLRDQEMLQDHRILQVHLQNRMLLDQEMLQDHRILQTKGTNKRENREKMTTRNLPRRQLGVAFLKNLIKLT